MLSRRRRNIFLSQRNSFSSMEKSGNSFGLSSILMTFWQSVPKAWWVVSWRRHFIGELRFLNEGRKVSAVGSLHLGGGDLLPLQSKPSLLHYVFWLGARIHQWGICSPSVWFEVSFSLLSVPLYGHWLHAKHDTQFRHVCLCQGAHGLFFYIVFHFVLSRGPKLFTDMDFRPVQGYIQSILSRTKSPY